MSGSPLEDHQSEDMAPLVAQATQAAGDADLVNSALDDYAAQTKPAPAPASDQQPKPTQTRTLRDLIAPKSATPPSGGVVGTAVSVGADVATGLAESPKAIVKGARDAAQELLDSTRSVGDWLNTNIGDMGAVQVFDKKGNFDPQYFPTTPEDNGPVLPGDGLTNRSVTGGAISGITQFLVGFAAGGKVLQGAGIAGKVGTLGEAAIKGMFADAFAFDPAQQRLSNLIQDVPSLQNPVTEFLASKPTDTEAVGRLKNAMEGLGVGALMQGAFTGALKGLRALKELKPAGPTAEEITKHVKDSMAPLGDPDAPLLATRDSAAKATAGATPDGLVSAGSDKAGKEVFINFARIDAPEDVKKLLGTAANKFSSDIAEAQRGVISHEATAALADDMGMSVQDLLSRRKGPNGARTPFTAEEALAARRIYTASGTKLMELAQKASAANAGAIDLFNFRKMMATHYAIQNEVLGARTETARALSSWRIGAGSGEEQLRAIQQAMETSGPDSVRMANELTRLQANGATPGAVAKYVRQSAFGTTMQGVREVYVNGLLSNPLTHIVNTSSNLGTLALSSGERFVARQVSKLTGSDSVAAGEASAMLYGMLEGQRDAFRLAWKTIRTGETTDLLGKTDQPRLAAIRSNDTGAFGTSVNAVGTVVRTPSLLMGSADQYFKAINYRAELHSTAVRTASGEGLSGSALATRVKEIMDNPPENLKLDAADSAQYNTFNNSMGWFGKGLMSLREGGGSVNPMWLITPFIRTPVNIARYSFERTPLAPLVGQWRADIAAGGARRDIALARVATGTMIMGLAQAGAQGGQVTGAAPQDAGESALWRREGRQEYSVKVGDNWYSYNRADPFGMIMGFAADMQTTLSTGDVSPKDVDEWQEVMAGGISAISQTAMDKTFMRGYSQFNDMLADPKRYGAKQINSVITGFIPFSALAGAVSRVTDPTQRDVKTPADAIMSRIPGLAARIIPRRDLWGQAVRDPNAIYNAISPLRASTEKPSAIDAELDRLRVYPDGIGWKASIDGVAVNFSDFPKALDEYRRLAGNEYKHPAWGVGLKDFLDETVSGKGSMSPVYKMYSDGEQGGKQAFIRDWITRYRDLAGQAVLADPKFADFKTYYEETKAAQRGARARVNLN